MNYRTNSEGIPVTDLGAELYPCKVCGSESVLMFSWCSKCRENYPEEFKKEQGTKLYYVDGELVPEDDMNQDGNVGEGKL